jgi:hypothetical protein
MSTYTLEEMTRAREMAYAQGFVKGQATERAQWNLRISQAQRAAILDLDSTEPLVGACGLEPEQCEGCQ